MKINPIHYLSESLEIYESKSDLVTRVQLEIKYPDLPSTCDCKIFDGAAVVPALPVTTVSTFEKYADNIFIASIFKHLQ